MSNDGASITQNKQYDPRISKAINWILGGIGTGIIAIGVWIASSITDLNNTVTRLVTQNESVFARLDVNERVDIRQDVQLGELTRDVAVIEGRVLRGQHPLQGQANGN
jgi:hypothetical protein